MCTHSSYRTHVCDAISLPSFCSHDYGHVCSSAHIPLFTAVITFSLLFSLSLSSHTHTHTHTPTHIHTHIHTHTHTLFTALVEKNSDQNHRLPDFLGKLLTWDVLTLAELVLPEMAAKGEELATDQQKRTSNSSTNKCPLCVR